MSICMWWNRGFCLACLRSTFLALTSPAEKPSTNILFSAAVAIVRRVGKTRAQAAFLLDHQQGLGDRAHQEKRRKPSSPKGRDITELAHQAESFGSEMGNITNQQYRHQ